PGPLYPLARHSCRHVPPAGVRCFANHSGRRVRDCVLGEVRFRPSLKRYAARERISPMGLLTFALNVTLDGCCDHREGVADDEMLRYWTRVMDAAGAMLFGRRTYELMEDAWPQVARDPKATKSNRDWAKKLEAKPKYVVSTTRRDFPWSNTYHV